MAAEYIGQRQEQGPNGPRNVIASIDKVYGYVNQETGNYHPPTLKKDIINSGASVSYLVNTLLSEFCKNPVDSKDLV